MKEDQNSRKTKRHLTLGCSALGICSCAGVVISYLLGSDFPCLTVGNLLYYRTSINKRKGRELFVNICKMVHEFQHQDLAMPAVQTVQYEFKRDESKKWVEQNNLL